MSSDIDSEKARYSAGLLDLLVVIAENSRMVMFVAIAAGIIAAGASYLIAPTYIAATRVLPPQSQQSAAALLASQFSALAAISGASGASVKNPADVYIALVKSRSVADRLIQRFDLMRLYEEKFREDARKKLAKATEVRAGKEGMLTIEFEAEDPALSAAIANAYVDELQKLSGQLAITEAQQRRRFFEQQLSLSNANLKRAEAALGEVGAGEDLIKSAPQVVVDSIARLKAQGTAQQIKLATMRGYLTETSPELQLAQRELDSLRSQISAAEQRQPAKGGARGDYLNRYRDFKYAEALFELVARQFEAARLDEAREGAVIQVVDTAVPPERKTAPHRALIAVLTAIVAGALAILFALLQESLRNARTDPAVSRKLSRIHTIFSSREER